jgi:formate-dependent nitrite reductase membrane component NrfD
MNIFVADPEWGWWIILYFYCGGIAAGAYFVAALIDLTGNEEDRALARLGYWIAFPLVIICGLLLIVDLHRPERFWHMLFKSEVVHQALGEGWPTSGASWRTMSHAFLLKLWSPMSIGAWALLLFGACSFFSWLGSLWPGGRLNRWFNRSVLARGVQLIGGFMGFFVAAYTGSLLTATNQPLWSDSDWIAPLFLASAASTGISTMLLLGHWQRAVAAGAVARLERADFWALALELVIFAVFLASLGAELGLVLKFPHGQLLIVGALLVGVLVPLALHVLLRGASQWRVVTTALFALLGGFVLRYAILTTPPEVLAYATEIPAGSKGLGDGSRIGTDSSVLIRGFSPEEGRTPGGGLGADPGNKPAELQPRSKVFHGD